MITIRRMTTGDEQQVLEASHLFDSPPDAEAVRIHLADPRDYLLIGYVDAQPAGFARAHDLPRLDRMNRMMFLYEIGVAPEYRRRGVARALIRELERVSRERRCQEMFVITSASNLPAMRLYESTGGQREAEDDVVFVYPYA